MLEATVAPVFDRIEARMSCTELTGGGPHDYEAAIAERGDIGIGFQLIAVSPGDSSRRDREAGLGENPVLDVVVGRAAEELVLVDSNEVAVGERRELRRSLTVRLTIEGELAADVAGGAHDLRQDAGFDAAGGRGIGDDIAAVGEGGDGRETLVRTATDRVQPERGAPCGGKNLDVDVGGGHIDRKSVV